MQSPQRRSRRRGSWRHLEKCNADKQPNRKGSEADEAQNIPGGPRRRSRVDRRQQACAGAGRRVEGAQVHPANEPARAGPVDDDDHAVQQPRLLRLRPALFDRLQIFRAAADGRRPHGVRRSIDLGHQAAAELEIPRRRTRPCERLRGEHQALVAARLLRREFAQSHRRRAGGGRRHHPLPPQEAVRNPAGRAGPPPGRAAVHHAGAHRPP